MLGLSTGVMACLLDLGGVLTQTAKVHAAAWKQMFDEYLRQRASRRGEQFVEFDSLADYNEYVDGKPRYEGVRSFLNSWGIELSEGTPEDPPTAETICELGNRKNELVLALIRDQGVEPYEGSVRYLKGKSAPDTFLAGARAVGVEPGQAAVFEDALAGVEAGRAGSFGYVIGVDRVGHADALRAHGADAVVEDLAELLDAS